MIPTASVCNVANCTVCHQKILWHVQAPAGSGHILVVPILMQWDSLCVKFVRTNNDFRLLGHNWHYVQRHNL